MYWVECGDEGLTCLGPQVSSLQFGGRALGEFQSNETLRGPKAKAFRANQFA